MSKYNEYKRKAFMWDELIRLLQAGHVRAGFVNLPDGGRLQVNKDAAGLAVVRLIGG